MRIEHRLRNMIAELPKMMGERPGQASALPNDGHVFKDARQRQNGVATSVAMLRNKIAGIPEFGLLPEKTSSHAQAASDWCMESLPRVPHAADIRSDESV